MHAQGLTNDYRLGKLVGVKKLRDEIAPVARFVRAHANLRIEFASP